MIEECTEAPPQKNKKAEKLLCVDVSEQSQM